MSNEFTNIIVSHVLSTGAKGDPNAVQTGTRAQSLINPEDNLGVSSNHKPPVHFPVIHNFQKPFNVHTSTPVLSFKPYPGSTNSLVAAVLDHAPNPTTAPGGTSSFVNQRLGGSGSPNPIDQPIQGAVGHCAPKQTTKGATPVATNCVDVPFIIRDQFHQLQSGHGVHGDERNVKWDRKTAIKTAETPFGSVPSLGMLRGLPGMVMSLAGTFKGLSKQQKQRIKANTSPQMYSLIEATLTNTTDVGDVEKYSLTSRVHKDTFANNMVDLLSQCNSYEDLRNCMEELRSNTALQGKDKLPTVEYRIKNTFGETGLIIDAHGEYKQNVSNAVAQAQEQFMQFITQGSDQIEFLAKFEGDIKGNTLNVIHMDFGRIVKGQYIYIEGPDVTDNTQIASFGTNVDGNTGIYYLTLESNTLPNTAMVLYKATPMPEKEEPQESGGGGGGGLGGMVGFFNTSMFGEAAKLMGEQIPVLDPKAAGSVMAMLKGVQSGQVLHRLSKLKGIVMKKFTGNFIG